jgi:hypothetical protein
VSSPNPTVLSSANFAKKVCSLPMRSVGRSTSWKTNVAQTLAYPDIKTIFS